MRNWGRALLWVFLLFSLLSSVVRAGAETSTDDIAGVGMSRQQLSTLAGDESNDQHLVYAQILEIGQEIESLEQQRLQSEDFLLNVRSQRTSLYQKNKRDNSKLLKKLNQLSLQQLQVEITKLEQGKEEYLHYLQNLGQMLDSLRTLVMDAQDSDVNSKKHTLVSDLLTLEKKQPSTVAEVSLQLAQSNLASARSSYFEYMLSKSGELLELYSELITATKVALNDTTTTLQLVRNALQEKRIQENSAHYQQLSKVVGDSVPLRQLMEENRQLIDELGLIYEGWESITDYSFEVQTQLARAQRIKQNLTSQIRNFSRTVFLSHQLFSQQELISSLEAPFDIDGKIEQLRILQYDLSGELEKISSFSEKYLQQRYPGFAQLKDDEQSNFQDLLSDRRSLIAKLYSEAGVQLGQLINLKKTMQRYDLLREEFNNSLMQEKLWTPSSNALDWTIFSKAWQDVQRLGSRFLSRNPEPNLPLWPLFVPLALALVLLSLRRRIIKWQDSFAERVKTPDDSHWLVWLSCGGDLLRALIIALIVLVVLEVVNLTVYPLSDSMFIPLSFVAVWIAEALILMHRPGGIDATYFRFRFPKSAHCSLARIYRTFTAVIIFRLWIMQSADAVVEDHFSQLMLFIALLVLFCSYLWLMLSGRLLQQECQDQSSNQTLSDQRSADSTNEQIEDLADPAAEEGANTQFQDGIEAKSPTSDCRPILENLTFDNSVLSGLYVLAIVLLLFTALVLTATGFHYTALILTANVALSIFIIDISLIICRAIFRTVRLSARRIRLMHDLMMVPATAGPDAASEVETISRQAHWFISLICVSACIVVIYTMVWDDLVHLTGYFRHIALYDTAYKQVSLWDVMVSIYALVLTAIVCINFPGFLKMLIFHRVKMLNQYSYSVITVIKYLIIAIGIIFCCYTLGLSWDRMQWLIAALSVGLGFGLQEIFANFVSGLIILFERPVRIGDTITLDDHSGTVTKIQIRATTINDFDHMEYVVPNRKLITSSLVNWTLSDTVSRVVIQATCAIGEDTVKIRNLLMKVVRDCKYVIADPEPSVFFAGFDNGILNFQVRAYVAFNSDRSPCIDALNEGIYNIFRNHGIRIALKGVEVYLATRDGTKSQKIEDWVMPSHNGNDVSENTKPNTGGTSKQ